MSKTLIKMKIISNWLLLIVLIVLIIKSNILLFNIFSIAKEYSIRLFIYSSFAAFSPILLLISFSFLFSNRGKILYLLAIDFVISMMFVADIIYARAFGHLISFFMIIAKGVTEDLGASVISLTKWSDFLMFLDLPILVIAASKIPAEKKANLKKSLINTAQIIILSVSIMFIQFTYLEKTKDLGNVILQPLRMSPLGYHMFDFYRFIYERNYELTQEDITRANNWFAENTKYQLPDDHNAYLKGIAQGKNIIVIQFESLENFVIKKSFYGQEITPNINKLLDSSIYFNNIYEQVRDGNSSDAELLFNTSVYPITTGSTFLRFGDNTYNSLPDLLNAQGYTSVAIHGDNKEFWNRNRVFPALGFDKYIAGDGFENKTFGGMGILDESLFTQSITEIEKIKEPFYFYIITLTSHMPFDSAQNIGCLALPNDDESSGYLQTINYTDKVFGEFYKRLAQKGILENSVIIMYGDHEGIHKYYNKTTLPPNDYKIPFIVHIPGMKGMVIEKIGGQVDMMPTIAYLLGTPLDKFANTVMGRNLFGDNLGTVILPNGRIIGQSENEKHLREAEEITDIIISGNFFSMQKN